MNPKGLRIAAINAVLLFLLNSMSLFATGIAPPASALKLIFTAQQVGTGLPIQRLINLTANRGSL